MSLKLKAFGLGLIAALAMSAMAVVNATATTGGHFTSENSHTILSGLDDASNPPKFHAFGLTVTCKHATYSSTAGLTETSISVSAVYGECSTSLGGSATVHMNGCTYVFTIGTNPATTDQTTHLVCPGQGPVITAQSPFSSHAANGYDCVLEVTPNQTPTGGVVYETGGTAGSGHDIVVNATTTGIHTVILTGGFAACGTSSTTTATGQLTGKATVTGKSTAGAAVGITAT
jgi:hypothetical protein